MSYACGQIKNKILRNKIVYIVVRLLVCKIQTNLLSGSFFEESVLHECDNPPHNNNINLKVVALIVLSH